MDKSLMRKEEPAACFLEDTLLADQGVVLNL